MISLWLQCDDGASLCYLIVHLFKAESGRSSINHRSCFLQHQVSRVTLNHNRSNICMVHTWLQTHLDAFSFGTRFTKMSHKCHSLPAVLLHPQNKSFTTSIFCVQCVFWGALFGVRSQLFTRLLDSFWFNHCEHTRQLGLIVSFHYLYDVVFFVCFVFMVTACWDKVVNCFPISYPQIKWNLLNILPRSCLFFSLHPKLVFCSSPKVTATVGGKPNCI